MGPESRTVAHSPARPAAKKAQAGRPKPKPDRTGRLRTLVCAGTRKAYFSLAESLPADVLMQEMSKESKKRFCAKQQVAEDTSREL